MADVTNKRVNIFIDSAAAENALGSLQTKADGFNNSIKKARIEQEALKKKIDETGKAGGDITKLQKRYDDLSDRIKGNTKSLKDNEAAQAKLADQIKNNINPSFVQQERYVKSLLNQLKQLPVGTQQYLDKLGEFKKANTTLSSLREQMDLTAKVQRNWFAEAKTVAFGVLIGNTLQSALSAVGGYLSGIVSGNAKLSDSLADVEKATGLTSLQVASLNSQLGKIDTRTSTENLRQIAIGLGQLGEAATAENVAAIDKIVVALGDEFGGGAKEITTTLSILRNNLQDLKTGNYGDDVARIGNALNVLGAEGLATAPVVTDFANRMAGIAGTFKLTSGEILGTAATFQELGINVERGSTAFTKVLQKIAAEPEKFAKVSGKSVKEFTDLVNNDMLAAFNSVAVGAAKAGSSNVVFAKILKELDADGSGAGEVLSKLSKNQELLTNKVALATDALQSQSSITEEFNKKNNNLAASLEKLGKSFNSFFANSTLVSILTGITEALANLFEKSKDVTEEFRDQDKVVRELQTNTVPLINRVDELQKKAESLGGTTKLSKDEQVELNKAIVTIGNTIPGAITQFDAYGNAIGISTEKARQFINLQQAILKEKNRDAIADQKDTLKKLQVEADAVFKSLNTRNAAGNLVTEVVTTSASGATSSRIVELTDAQIQGRQKQLAEIQERIKGIKGIIEELNGENLKVPEVTKTETPVIPGTPIDPFADTKKVEDKTKQLREEYLKLRADVTQTIDQLTKSSFAFAFDKIFQDKAEQEKQINDFFKKGVISGKERDEALRDIQRETEAKVKKLIDDLNSKVKEDPVTVDVIPEIEEEDIEVLRRSMRAFSLKLSEDSRNEAAKRALALLIGTNKEKLDATIGNLNEAERQELANTDLLESEKEVIRERYRQARNAAELEFVQKEIQNIQGILDFTSQAIEVASRFNQIRTNKENAVLKKELDANELRKKSYQSQLNAKILSQAEYERKVAALDTDSLAKQEAVKKKQFERDKKFQLGQALIAGAKAIISGFATVPFIPAGLLAGALATTLTAAQVAVIASQKYAGGGKVEHPGNGKITSRQNIPTQHNGDDVLATVKRGEVILNERQQRALGGANTFRRIGVPGFANGGYVRPAYETRSYQAVNYGKINQSYGYLKFAEGGRVSTSGPTAESNPVADPAFANTLTGIQNALYAVAKSQANLEQQLQQPIRGDWSFNKLKDAEDLQARRKKNSQFQ